MYLWNCDFYCFSCIYEDYKKLAFEWCIEFKRAFWANCTKSVRLIFVPSATYFSLYKLIRENLPNLFFSPFLEVPFYTIFYIYNKGIPLILIFPI